MTEVIVLGICIGANIGVLYMIKKIYDEYKYHMEKINKKEEQKNAREQDEQWSLVDM